MALRYTTRLGERVVLGLAVALAVLLAVRVAWPVDRLRLAAVEERLVVTAERSETSDERRATRERRAGERGRVRLSSRSRSIDRSLPRRDDDFERAVGARARGSSSHRTEPNRIEYLSLPYVV